MGYTLSVNFAKQLGSPTIWKMVSAKVPMTEEEIDTYQKYLDWNEISRHQPMSYDFIMRHRGRLNAHELALNEKLDESLLSDLIISKVISGRDVSRRKGLSASFIRLQKNDLDERLLEQTGYSKG